MKKNIINAICMLFILGLIWPLNLSYAAETNPIGTTYNKYYSDVIPGRQRKTSGAQGTWHEDSIGWWFEYSGGGYPTNTWEYINNYWYYFNGDGYMLVGWQSINGYWYYLEVSSTASVPQGAMRTGWLSLSSKEYYLEESANATTPQGSMITGWRNFPVVNGTTTKDQWAFFNLTSGECEVKQQVSIGCIHGKTTYDDNTLLTAKTNITYTYVGEKFMGNVIEGANNWTKSSAGITLAFVESTAETSPKIIIYDTVLNTDYRAITKFAIGGSYIDPRSDDWALGEIHLNTLKTTEQIRSGIVVHEIGHALGLDHRDADTVSVMRPDIASGSRNVPAAIDISNIQHLY